MGCMCAECMFAKLLKDSYKEEIAICVCRKSEYFLHELDFYSDNCEIGIVEDPEEGEQE